MATSSLSGNLAISADLLYSFYDNKVITPKIRAALQKRQEEEDAAAASEAGAGSSSSSSSAGPATRVSISDQLIRMSITNNSAKLEDLKSKVETSQEVKDIENRLKEEAEKSDATDTESEE